MINVHSDYLEHAKLTNRERVVQTIVQELQPHKEMFDTIVCTGVSGLLYAPIVAYLMKKHLAIVRKSPGNSHASQMVEGELGKRWVVLDDFIRCGDTLRTIRDKVSEALKDNGIPLMSTRPVGVVFYKDLCPSHKEIQNILGDVFIVNFLGA
jgi:adenine/guanine phosphoribosyltransferase-like PRPP-binding protein